MYSAETFQSGHYDAKDFLSYFYYGGMVYTALKNYNRALYFFEMVRTSVVLRKWIAGVAVI